MNDQERYKVLDATAKLYEKEGRPLSARELLNFYAATTESTIKLQQLNFNLKQLAKDGFVTANFMEDNSGAVSDVQHIEVTGNGNRIIVDKGALPEKEKERNNFERDKIAFINKAWDRVPKKIRPIIFLVLIGGGIWSAFRFSPEMWQDQSKGTTDSAAESRTQHYSNKPEIEVSIGSDKILYLTNKGPYDLADIKIYVTEYWLKGQSYLKRPEIADFQISKEPAYQQLELKIDNPIKLPLTESPRFRFYENPGNGGDDDPILKNYALRIIARNSFSKQKYVHYELTSAIKNFASLVDSYGTVRAGQYSDFITDLPIVLKTHQRKLFGDSNIEEI